jgi:hypothetical protein
MSNLVIGSSVLLGMFAALPIISGQTAASSAPVSTSHVQAQLLNGVKAAKAKANDPVRAQTMTPLAISDGTVIPVGSTLSGHVVKVESDSPDGHTSSIAITFESVELKKHQTLPLKLSIASAMAPTPAGMGNNTYQTASRSANGVTDSHALDGHAYTAKETAGWLMTLRNNGLAAANAYGQYLGNRYKKFPNVAWLSGNDFGGWQKESDDALVKAVAKGIKSADPGHIQTVEFDPPFGSSLDDVSWAAIISINGAYIYGPTYIQVLHNYNQTPVMPVFLMEAHYELERVGRVSDYGTPPVLRREEYWAMLSGGKGQFYGNFYTWSFASGWKYYIDTPGAAQVTIWKDFFSALPWQDLVPDQDHSVLTAGLGNYGDLQTPVSISDYATASKTPDGSYVAVYMPTVRTITVNMASLKGNAVAKWFDPTNAAYTSISGQSFPNKGTQQFTPPGNNHDGDGDWILLLDASK